MDANYMHTQSNAEIHSAELAGQLLYLREESMNIFVGARDNNPTPTGNL
jgi:hypothetical protein